MVRADIWKGTVMGNYFMLETGKLDEAYTPEKIAAKEQNN